MRTGVFARTPVGVHCKKTADAHLAHLQVPYTNTKPKPAKEPNLLDTQKKNE